MPEKIHILCPEYVPIENKGEEAIIRGTVDVVFPNEDCEYHIVDLNTKEYRYVNKLHIHPGGLFFSDWRSREFGLGFTWNKIYSSSCSLLRNFLNKFFPKWISRPHKQAVLLKKYLSGEKQYPKKYEKSITELKKVNYIIAGHNGGLNEYVCHILNELHSINIPFGIFGSSMKPKIKEPELLKVFNKTFSLSDFNIARNPLGYNWAINNFPNLNFELKPDPAFGMLPANEVNTKRIIKKYNLESFFEKPVVMVTTAEPAPIIRYSFDSSIGTVQKTISHRKFLAEFLKLLSTDNNINILFLPHTIGPNKNMDDRIIASDVIYRAGLKGCDNIRLLEADLTAKELKGLINMAEFIIGERVHSIIGAIGVNSPFLCLASKHDTRVQGIICEQMEFCDRIYYLNNPSPIDAYKLFMDLFNDRVKFIEELKERNKTIRINLNSSGEKINRIIRDKLIINEHSN